MIDNVAIRNYRSCLDTAFTLQPDLTVLIGPNGTGKTNVMAGLLLLKKLADERNRRYTTPDDQGSDECTLTVSFRKGKKIAKLRARILLLTDDDNTDQILAAEQNWDISQFTTVPQPLNVPLWVGQAYREDQGRRHSGDRTRLFIAREALLDLKIPKGFLTAFLDISEFASDLKYYSASQFTNPAQCPVSIEIDKSETSRRYVQRSRGHSKFLHDLYSEFRSRETSEYDRFFEIIGPGGIGLVDKIEFKEFATSSVDYSARTGGKVRKIRREKSLVIPRFKIDGNTLSPSQLSEGTFKTITLLFYVVTQKSSCLLLEEPEVCVHHGLLSSIIELIKVYSKKKQIILSTHSESVLDQIDSRCVYKVTRSRKTGTIVRHVENSMSSKDVAALKHYLEVEGNLGEYWRDGGLD